MKQCRLCRNKRELKYSHIIPEFFYKWLYDDKHRYRTFSTYENRPRPMEQKGMREHLLCSECEAKLSGWETYACNILTDDAVQFGDHDHRIVMDVDYEKFKLFELSILWRVSVANHQLCKRVRLSDHEEEDLRSFISEGRAPKANEYGSIKFALLKDDGRRQMDYIPQPEPICDENRAISMAFGGIRWLFIMDSRQVPKKSVEYFLQDNGKLHILRDKFSDEINRNLPFGIRLQEMGRLRW